MLVACIEKYPSILIIKIMPMYLFYYPCLCQNTFIIKFRMYSPKEKKVSNVQLLDIYKAL